MRIRTFEFFDMEKELQRDKITGALIGGAVGDALGFHVESLRYSEIVSQYGKNGITHFNLREKGVSLISANTQMSLFTANGLLYGQTRMAMKGIGAPLESYVETAYLEWYETQTHIPEFESFRCCWIRNINALNCHRYLDNTCLSVLEADRNHNDIDNDSCECGGVVRVAPVGLFSASYISHMIKELFGTNWKLTETIKTIELGMKCAEITHKHPIGYIPAGLMAGIIQQLCLSDGDMTRKRFEEIVKEQCELLPKICRETQYISQLAKLIYVAIELAKNNEPDVKNIHSLGGGRTGDTVLAIAVYCSMRYIDNFEKAIVAAVNHDGASASVGAVCGNIMGVICGYEAIPDYYKDNLELADVIYAMGVDLAQLCIVSEYGRNDSPEQLIWLSRYVHAYPYGFPYLPMKKIDLCYEIPGMCVVHGDGSPNVNWLLKKDIPKFFFFNKAEPESGNSQEAMLSIWWNCEFEIEKTEYNCVGQYMQAEKARIFGDLDARDKILAAKTKSEILIFGRSINNYDDEKWRKAAYSVSLCGNYYKFVQNEDCKEALHGTKDLILVKDSEYDRFWGVGMNRQDIRISNPKEWKGKNLLGFALMEVRETLLSNKLTSCYFGMTFTIKKIEFYPEDIAFMNKLPTHKEKMEYVKKLRQEKRYIELEGDE